tara:strand:+ start:371 stop:856 length:486 start_codon:yes stop_codon:yes gene_type:complete
MNARFSFFFSLFFSLVIPLSGILAQTTTPSLSIEAPFSRATKGKNGAVFFKIQNLTDRSEKVIKATVSKNIADHCELHSHEKVGDVYQMREVDAIVIPAQGQVDLKPGGLHIMLMGLKAPLSQKFFFELTLFFDRGMPQTILVPIRGVGAKNATCKCGEKD